MAFGQQWHVLHDFYLFLERFQENSHESIVPERLSPGSIDSKYQDDIFHFSLSSGEFRF